MAKRYIKITPFYNKPSTLGPLSAARLNALNDGLDAVDTYKIDVDQIIQTTSVNDAAKVPSSAVTYSLANQITTLNNNLATINAVTAGANITINSGGYIKIGRLVFVHLKITASVGIAAYTPICTGLPSSLTGVKALVINDATAANVDGVYKDGTGGIASTAPLTAGTYNVTCVYFSAS